MRSGSDGQRTQDDERLSGGLAGVVGVLLVLVLAGGITYVVRRRTPSPSED